LQNEAQKQAGSAYKSAKDTAYDTSAKAAKAWQDTKKQVGNNGN
jgi:hypothetical protein